MNPKAAEVWNFALAKMESARRYIEQDQEGPAKTQIAKAVYVGAGALYYLLGQGPEEQAAHQAAQSFIAEMTAADSSAAEAYLAARRILAYIADISPAEDRLHPRGQHAHAGTVKQVWPCHPGTENDSDLQT